MLRTWLATLLVFAALIIQAQCGHAPNGGGIVDNGAKPKKPSSGGETPSGDDSGEGQIESFARPALTILDNYEVDVASGNWSVEAHKETTKLSNRKTTLNFWRIAPFAVEIDETNQYGIDIAWMSPTQTAFVIDEDIFLWVDHDTRTPEIDAIFRSLRERSK